MTELPFNHPESMHVCTDPVEHLSANFKAGEFRSPGHVGPWWVSGRLIEMLEALRVGTGSITVTSGFRSSERNGKVGGATSSQHLFGRAADIKVSGMTPMDLAHAAYMQGFRRIGVAQSFVHVDVGPGEAYWVYRTSGKGTDPANPRTIEIIKTGK